MPTNALDVAREYFPGESDAFLDGVLWNQTAFPFNLDDLDRLRGQLAWVADAMARCVNVDRVIWDEICAVMDKAKEAADAAE